MKYKPGERLSKLIIVIHPPETETLTAMICAIPNEFADEGDGKPAEMLILDETPDIISLGRECVDNRRDFLWLGSQGKPPYFRDKGVKTILKVENYCPVLKNPVATDNTTSSIVPGASLTEVVDSPVDEPEGEAAEEPGDDPDALSGELVDTTPEVLVLPPEPECPPVVDGDREASSPSKAYKQAAYERRLQAALQPHGQSVGSLPQSARVPPPPAVEPNVTREMRLRREAKSDRHKLLHFPKKPYCRIGQSVKP